MDDYEMVRVLGEGSFGSAILARQKTTQKLLVLKRIPLYKLSGQAVTDAKKEVQVLSSLHHPHITQFMHSLECDGELIIGMEYCGGGDLKALMNQRAGVLFPQDRVLDWFVQLCLAVKYVHDKHILHRDIKAQNIFLTQEGRIKLGDFGISKVLESTKDLASTCIGTPYYLSPEMCQNKPYNSKSDVWALGCVLYEMAALKHPFQATCMKNLIMNILKGCFRPVPSKFTWDFKALIRQILQGNPLSRPSVTTILAKRIMLDRVPRFLEGIEGNMNLMIALREREDTEKRSKKNYNSVPDLSGPAAKYGQNMAFKKHVRRTSPLSNGSVKRPSLNFVPKSAISVAKKTNACLPKAPKMRVEPEYTSKGSAIISYKRYKSKSVEHLQPNKSFALKGFIDCNSHSKDAKQTPSGIKILSPNVESILQDINNGKYYAKSDSPIKHRDCINKTRTIKTNKSSYVYKRRQRQRSLSQTIIRGKSVDSLIIFCNDKDSICNFPIESGSPFDNDYIIPKDINIKGQYNRKFTKNPKLKIPSVSDDKKHRFGKVPFYGKTFDINVIKLNSQHECRPISDVITNSNRCRLFSQDISPVSSPTVQLKLSQSILQRSASMSDLLEIVSKPSLMPMTSRSQFKLNDNSEAQTDSNDNCGLQGQSISPSLLFIDDKCPYTPGTLISSIRSSTPVRHIRSQWGAWDPSPLSEATLETTRSQMDATTGADKVIMHVKSNLVMNNFASRVTRVTRVEASNKQLDGNAVSVLGKVKHVELDLIRMTKRNEIDAIIDKKLTANVKNVSSYMKSSGRSKSFVLDSLSPKAAGKANMLNKDRRQWSLKANGELVEVLNKARIVETTLDALQTSALVNSLVSEFDTPLCSKLTKLSTKNLASNKIKNAKQSVTVKEFGNVLKLTSEARLLMLKPLNETYTIPTTVEEQKPIVDMDVVIDNEATNILDGCIDKATVGPDAVSRTNCNEVKCSEKLDTGNTQNNGDKPQQRLLNLIFGRDGGAKGGFSDDDDGDTVLSKEQSPAAFDDGSKHSCEDMGSIVHEKYDVDNKYKSRGGLSNILRKMALLKTMGQKVSVTKPVSCRYKKVDIIQKCTKLLKTEPCILPTDHSHVKSTDKADRDSKLDFEINYDKVFDECNFDLSPKNKNTVDENSRSISEMGTAHSLREECSNVLIIPSLLNCTVDESGYNTQTAQTCAISDDSLNINTGLKNGGVNLIGALSKNSNLDLPVTDKLCKFSTGDKSISSNVLGTYRNTINSESYDLQNEKGKSAVTGLAETLDRHSQQNTDSPETEILTSVTTTITSGFVSTSMTELKRKEKDVQVRRLAEILVENIIRKSLENCDKELSDYQKTLNDNSEGDDTLKEIDDLGSTVSTMQVSASSNTSTLNDVSSIDEDNLLKIVKLLDPSIVTCIQNLDTACRESSPNEISDVHLKELNYSKDPILSDPFSHQQSNASRLITRPSCEMIDDKICAHTKVMVADHFYPNLHQTLHEKCAENPVSLTARPSVSDHTCTLVDDPSQQLAGYSMSNPPLEFVGVEVTSTPRCCSTRTTNFIDGDAVKKSIWCNFEMIQTTLADCQSNNLPQRSSMCKNTFTDCITKQCALSNEDMDKICLDCADKTDVNDYINTNNFGKTPNDQEQSDCPIVIQMKTPLIVFIPADDKVKISESVTTECDSFYSAISDCDRSNPQINFCYSPTTFGKDYHGDDNNCRKTGYIDAYTENWHGNDIKNCDENLLNTDANPSCANEASMCRIHCSSKSNICTYVCGKDELNPEHVSGKRSTDALEKETSNIECSQTISEHICDSFIPETISTNTAIVQSIPSKLSNFTQKFLVNAGNIENDDTIQKIYCETNCQNQTIDVGSSKYTVILENIGNSIDDIDIGVGFHNSSATNQSDCELSTAKLFENYFSAHDVQCPIPKYYGLAQEDESFGQKTLPVSYVPKYVIDSANGTAHVDDNKGEMDSSNPGTHNMHSASCPASFISQLIPGLLSVKTSQPYLHTTNCASNKGTACNLLLNLKEVCVYDESGTSNNITSYVTLSSYNSLNTSSNNFAVAAHREHSSVNLQCRPPNACVQNKCSNAVTSPLGSTDVFLDAEMPGSDVFGWIEEQRDLLEDKLGLETFLKCHNAAVSAAQGSVAEEAFLHQLTTLLTPFDSCVDSSTIPSSGVKVEASQSSEASDNTKFSTSIQCDFINSKSKKWFEVEQDMQHVTDEVPNTVIGSGSELDNTYSSSPNIPCIFKVPKISCNSTSCTNLPKSLELYNGMKPKNDYLTSSQISAINSVSKIVPIVPEARIQECNEKVLTVSDVDCVPSALINNFFRVNNLDDQGSTVRSTTTNATKDYHLSNAQTGLNYNEPSEGDVRIVINKKGNAVLSGLTKDYFSMCSRNASHGVGADLTWQIKILARQLLNLVNAETAYV